MYITLSFSLFSLDLNIEIIGCKNRSILKNPCTLWINKNLIFFFLLWLAKNLIFFFCGSTSSNPPLVKKKKKKKKKNKEKEKRKKSALVLFLCILGANTVFPLLCIFSSSSQFNCWWGIMWKPFSYSFVKNYKNKLLIEWLCKCWHWWQGSWS